MLRTARWLLAAAGVTVVVAGLPLTGAGAQASGDWPAYLNNVARTGFNSAETLITPSTAPNLTQLWADHAGGAVSAEPIQASGVVYYGSWDGHEYAADATTGAQLWQSPYLGQSSPATCTNPPTVGVASTATAGTITVNGTATETVFVGGGDGTFYALDAATGAVLWQTPLGTPPDYFLWSSPLVYNGSIYEGVASFLDCPLVRSAIVQLDAATGTIQHTLYTAPAGCTGAGVWGSPAVDTTTGDLYFATGNGGPCASPEPLAIALVQTDSNLNVLSSWQVPPSQQPNTDSDFGSTPTLFTATISGTTRQMVGLQNKNGIYYAFDRSAIASGPLWQKRMAGGGTCPECANGHGADISPSAYDGQYLFVGSEKTTIGGVTCLGSLRALRPSTGKVVWADCLPSQVLGAVTAVPGVAFAGAGTTVYAVNTSTGAILWRYQDTSSGSAFWGAPTISNGHAYFGNQDGTLYAFGP
jgi:outer membrane protein assembly factor BamB